MTQSIKLRPREESLEFLLTSLAHKQRTVICIFFLQRVGINVSRAHYDRIEKENMGYFMCDFIARLETLLSLALFHKQNRTPFYRIGISTCNRNIQSHKTGILGVFYMCFQINYKRFYDFVHISTVICTKRVYIYSSEQLLNKGFHRKCCVSLSICVCIGNERLCV